MTFRSPRSRFVRKAVAAVAPALLLLATAGSALASTKQETILQDDRLFGDPSQQVAALDDAKALGVTTIHTVVVWRTLAPNPDSRTKPRGFNGADPKKYPLTNWDRFDSLVTEASKRGIKLLMSPSGPMPLWASTCKSKSPVCGPNLKEYQAFVTALAKRYNGRYVDENQSRTRLPKVARYSVWNEPNLASWLQPAKQNASIYRNLVYAAETGLSKAGQGRAQLLISDAAPLRSLTFYRRLFCIDTRGRTLTGRAARVVGCNGRRIKKFRAVGIAHHPYQRGGSPPFKRGRSDDGTLGDTSALLKVLDQAARVGAVRRGIPVYFTEFGIASTPPSIKYAVPLPQQATAINHAEFLGYINRRVLSYAQYQLSDDTNIGSEAGTPILFQTGLRFGDGTPKPAYDAFRMPIWLTASGKAVRVWGGVRPGARTRVAIQSQASNGTWSTVRTVTVNRYGYIDQRIPKPSGKVRLLWTSSQGTQFTSREATTRDKP
jgi:hypothetical protein